MVVDFLRPGSADFDTMGLPSPRFDELINPDPALENYDYIFLNDWSLLKTKDGRIGQPRYKSSDEIVLLHPEGLSRPPPPPPPQPVDYERWDPAVINDGRRPTSERTAVNPSSIPQKKVLLGTTQMTEHQLLLMPNRAPAFSTSTKKWRMYMSE
jgi:hypothetical protein